MNSPERAGVRPEIQGLRALAVALVVVYHFWPSAVPGGFVGVDVFFVVSGFLITGHLLREVETTGRLDLPGFWARRARRLLPASLLVLGVTLVAVILIVPGGYWQQYLREVVASTLYVQNWQLAVDAVDYLDAANTASPVQHFWSLSVEEQFYLVWPLLVLLALALARLLPGSRRLWIGGVLAAVTVASLVCSIVITAADPAWAYFITPTRAWEFAAGGLLAFAPSWLSRPGLRGAVTWLGAALILVAARALDGGMPFPGVLAAIPVIGTLLVLAGGRTESFWSLSRWSGIRPVQWLGDVSYSVYLWHWPLIVLTPFLLGGPLDVPTQGVLLVLTLGLAGLTKVFVEDPFRRARPLVTRKPRWTFALALVGMLALVAPAVVTQGQQAQSITAELEEVEELLEQEPICLGAPAAEEANATFCPDPSTWTEVYPSPRSFSADLPAIYSERCRTDTGETSVKECVYGDPDSERRIVLAGDSHAAQWFPPLRAIAEERGWALHVFFRSGCPLRSPERTTVGGDQAAACGDWSQRVFQRLTKLEPDVLVTSALARYRYERTGTGESVNLEAAGGGYEVYWRQLLAQGTAVVAIADTPRMSTRTIECLATSGALPLDCQRSREGSFPGEDELALAAHDMPEVELLDVSDLLCDAEVCPAVIGQMIVYRDDSSHMTATFTRTLTPYLEASIDAALLRASGGDAAR